MSRHVLSSSIREDMMHAQVVIFRVFSFVFGFLGVI